VSAREVSAGGLVMRGLAGRLLVSLTVGGCASPGTPPGGPERLVPPRLVRVAPESGAVNVRPRAVVFEYDAVVSETPRGGGGGATGLESIVTVSPRSGSVEVDWQRDRIAVRPRRGFRPNLTYTVTVLPGLQDLRNNVRDSASVAIFSTGGPIATASVRGVAFDWVNNRPAARAVVEATGADSVTYFAVADSAGRFAVANIPPGSYLVRATVDVNGNRAADPREAFDTVRAVAAARRAPTTTDTSGLALYAYVRDSLPPRLTNVEATDSATLRLTFDRALRPEQPFAGRVRVIGPDSAAIPVRAVLTPTAADSAADAAARASAGGARADSAAPGTVPRDSTARTPNPTPRRPAATDSAATAPRLARPVPPTELVVQLATPLRPGATVRVRVTDLRSLSNVVGASERTFTAPSAAPAPNRPPATPPAQPPAPRPNAPASAPPTGAPPPAAPPPAARRP